MTLKEIQEELEDLELEIDELDDDSESNELAAATRKLLVERQRLLVTMGQKLVLQKPDAVQTQLLGMIVLLIDGLTDVLKALNPPKPNKKRKRK